MKKIVFTLRNILKKRFWKIIQSRILKQLLTERFSLSLLIIGICILIISILPFVWKEFNSLNTNSKLQADKIAQFGDFIGGVVGSIWALAGVVLFYVALREQRKDFGTNRDVLKAQTKALEIQIEEFQNQVEEMRIANETALLQTKTFNKQQFDSTFFNLINLHKSILESINLKTKEVHEEGGFMYVNVTDHEACLKIAEILDKKFLFLEYTEVYVENLSNTVDEISVDKLSEKINKECIKLFNKNVNLYRYFTNLYHIYKFIENSEVENKKQYSRIIRAQLSNGELHLIFYNGLTEYGRKFKPLLEKHNVFNNFVDSGYNTSEIRSLYDQKAFE